MAEEHYPQRDSPFEWRVKAVGAVEDAEAEVGRIARGVIIDLGIPVVVDFVEAKTNPRGVPFGKELVEVFGIRFKALQGRLKVDKSYVRAEDVADNSPRVKERIRAFLTEHYEAPASPSEPKRKPL